MHHQKPCDPFTNRMYHTCVPGIFFAFLLLLKVKIVRLSVLLELFLDTIRTSLNSAVMKTSLTFKNYRTWLIDLLTRVGIQLTNWQNTLIAFIGGGLDPARRDGGGRASLRFCQLVVCPAVPLQSSSGIKLACPSSLILSLYLSRCGKPFRACCVGKKRWNLQI